MRKTPGEWKTESSSKEIYLSQQQQPVVWEIGEKRRMSGLSLSRSRPPRLDFS
jgi:hypothetical protein